MYPTSLGHVHLRVRDFDRAITFSKTFFNLQVIEHVGQHYAFLRDCLKR